MQRLRCPTNPRNRLISVSFLRPPFKELSRVWEAESADLGYERSMAHQTKSRSWWTFVMDLRPRHVTQLPGSEAYRYICYALS